MPSLSTDQHHYAVKNGTYYTTNASTPQVTITTLYQLVPFTDVDDDVVVVVDVDVVGVVAVFSISLSEGPLLLSISEPLLSFSSSSLCLIFSSLVNKAL